MDEIIDSRFADENAVSESLNEGKKHIDNGGPGNVDLYIRLRPTKEERHIVQVDKTRLSLSAPPDSASFKNFHIQETREYSTIFGPEATQSQLFESVGLPAVKALFDNQSRVIVAVGVTGSGKSYTMRGPPTQSDRPRHETEGLLPRVLRNCVARIKGDCRLTVSALEIYGSKLRDLLAEDSASKKKKKITVREDYGEFVIQPPLFEVEMKDSVQTLHLFKKLDKTLTVSATELNATSSRGHTVVTIQLKQGDGPASKITLLDMAGIERVSKSKAEGTTLKEAISINKSLSAVLGVIRQLNEEEQAKKRLSGSKRTLKRCVSWRESVLTKLLKSTFYCGPSQAQVVLLATVNPEKSTFDETRQCLVALDKAKGLKLCATEVKSRLSITSFQRRLSLTPKAQKKDAHAFDGSKTIHIAGFSKHLMRMRKGKDSEEEALIHSVDDSVRVSLFDGPKKAFRRRKTRIPTPTSEDNAKARRVQRLMIRCARWKVLQALYRWRKHAEAEKMREANERCNMMLNDVRAVQDETALTSPTICPALLINEGRRKRRKPTSSATCEIQRLTAQLNECESALLDSTAARDELEQQNLAMQFHFDSLREQMEYVEAQKLDALHQLVSRQAASVSMMAQLEEAEKSAEYFERELEGVMEHTKLWESESGSSEGLERENSELKLRLESADAKMAAMKTDHAAQCDAFTEELSAVHKSLASLRTQLSGGEQARVEAHESLKSAQLQIVELEKTQLASQSYIDTLDGENQLLGQLREELQGELSDSNAALEQLRSSVAAELDALKESARSSLESAQRGNKALQGEIERLHAELNLRDGRLADQAEAQEALQEELHTARKRSDSLQEELSSARKQLKQSAEAHSALKSEHADERESLKKELAAERTELRSSAEGARSSLESAQRGNKALQGEIERLHAELNLRDGRLADQAEAREALQEELHTARKRSDSLQEELSSARKQLKQSVEAHSALKSEHADERESLKKELAAERTELEQLKSAHGSLSEVHGALKTELAELVLIHDKQAAEMIQQQSATCGGCKETKLQDTFQKCGNCSQEFCKECLTTRALLPWKAGDAVQVCRHCASTLEEFQQDIAWEETAEKPKAAANFPAWMLGLTGWKGPL